MGQLTIGRAIERVGARSGAVGEISGERVHVGACGTDEPMRTDGCALSDHYAIRSICVPRRVTCGARKYRTRATPSLWSGRSGREVLVLEPILACALWHAGIAHLPHAPIEH